MYESYGLKAANFYEKTPRTDREAVEACKFLKAYPEKLRRIRSVFIDRACSRNCQY